MEDSWERDLRNQSQLIDEAREEVKQLEEYLNNQTQAQVVQHEPRKPSWY